MKSSFYTKRFMFIGILSFIMVFSLNYYFNYTNVYPFMQLMSGNISGAIASAIDLKYFFRITVIIFTETVALSGVFFMASKKLLQQ